MDKLTNKKRILKALRSGMGTSNDIAERSGVKAGTVRYYMSVFHAEGLVTVDHVDRVGNPCFVWRLVDG